MWMKCPAIDLYRDLFQVQFPCWDHIYSLHKSFWHLSTSLYFKVRLIWALKSDVWECIGKGKAWSHSCCIHYVFSLMWFFLELLRNLFSFLFLWVSLSFPSLWPHSALAPLERLTSWPTFLLNPPLSPCPQVPAVVTFPSFFMSLLPLYPYCH